MLIFQTKNKSFLNLNRQKMLKATHILKVINGRTYAKRG